MLAVSKAPLLLADAASAPAVAALGPVEGLTIWVDPGTEPLPAGFRPLSEELDASSDAEPASPQVTLRDMFLYIYIYIYIYTSGTTGYPKPALVRHKFTMGA